MVDPLSQSIFDDNGNGALDPNEFVSLVYEALSVLGTALSEEGAFKIAAALASSSAWGGGGTVARVDASMLREAAAAGVFSRCEQQRPRPFAFEGVCESGVACTELSGHLHAPDVRARLALEPNAVTYTLPRNGANTGITVPLEPSVSSGIHEIVFSVRSDPHSFTGVGFVATGTPLMMPSSWPNSTAAGVW